VTSFPAMLMRPVLNGSKPAMAFISVVLPQPEGPSRQTNSPCLTLKHGHSEFGLRTDFLCEVPFV
jgi:hypothetical protein